MQHRLASFENFDEFSRSFRSGIAALQARRRLLPRFALFCKFAEHPAAMRALHAAIVHRWAGQQRFNLLFTLEEAIEWFKANWLEILKLLLALAPLFFKGVKGVRQRAKGRG